MEPDGSAQVAVFVDFENLVLGAVKELPDQANPAPYEALTRLCRGYGNASDGGGTGGDRRVACAVRGELRR